MLIIHKPERIWIIARHMQGWWRMAKIEDLFSQLKGEPVEKEKTPDEALSTLVRELSNAYMNETIEDIIEASSNPGIKKAWIDLDNAILDGKDAEPIARNISDLYSEKLRVKE